MALCPEKRRYRERKGPCVCALISTCTILHHTCLHIVKLIVVLSDLGDPGSEIRFRLGLHHGAFLGRASLVFGQLLLLFPSLPPSLQPGLPCSEAKIMPLETIYVVRHGVKFVLDPFTPLVRHTVAGVTRLSALVLTFAIVNASFGLVGLSTTPRECIQLPSHHQQELLWTQPSPPTESISQESLGVTS